MNKIMTICFVVFCVALIITVVAILVRFLRRKKEREKMQHRYELLEKLNKSISNERKSMKNKE